MRLLFCNLCKTLEEVPDLDHDLEEGEVDPLIEELVRQHNVRDPMGHAGSDLPHSPMRLAHVKDEDWEKDRPGIIRRINESNKKVGLDAWVSEATNTYQEDALLCFGRHHRPKGACIDWHADDRRIGRPTAEGRSVVKNLYKLGKKDPYLCDFCPVASWVTTQKRWQAGMYKER